MTESSTSTTTFQFEPEGYVKSTVRYGTRFDLDAARECVAMTWKVAGGRRRPLLVDMTGLLEQTYEARNYFISEEVARVVSAVALVVGPPVSRIIASFILRTAKLHVPTKVFNSVGSARTWILERIDVP